MLGLPALLAVTAAILASSVALDNGLARTPPMGWMSWQRFGCNTDCTNDPDNCISEKLYMKMADLLVSGGYKDAGYVYVNIDDCWAAKERDPKTNRLVGDPDRFPSGIKALADYMHNKGLKLGIYGDMGWKTCGGYPGSKFTMELDAQTFADWGIDSFKMDGCASDAKDFNTAYPIMSFYLNKTGRPMIFSCSWPYYMDVAGLKVDYAPIAKACNMWRNVGDIADSWDTVTRIIREYGDDKYNFSLAQGPGAFNDPDVIIAGSKGLSPSQEKVQMAMWAMFASPMLLSADLREVKQASHDLMTNKAVIAINQDKLGVMGKRVYWPNGENGDTQVWTKPILPEGSYAMSVFNKACNHHGQIITFKLADIGIKLNDKPLRMTEVFEGKDLGVIHTWTNITVRIDVSSVFLAKLTPTSIH